MPMDPHEAAAIAQIIFYVPMVPTSLYLCVRNWKAGPRMAWYPMVTFSIGDSLQTLSIYTGIFFSPKAYS
jgi:hypothetical protein